MSSVALLLIMLFGMLAIGVPIGVCLIFPIFILITFDPVTNSQYLAQVMYSGVANFTMMALPFFMLAGAVMDVGGLSKRLVRIANSMIGNVTGSLGMVSILGCMFFGAVSGSAPATCAAIGTIMLPQMVRNGYDKYYAVALITCAGSLGVIVPPSYPMVIYGVTNNVSIGTLFLGGIGPAVVVGGILMLINYVYCRKHKIKGNRKLELKEIGASLWNGLPALLMPVIILGGIYSGAFTPTEAAVIAVVYGVIVGIFVYKELKISVCLKLFYENGIFIGGTLLTMAPAAALGQIFAILGVTRSISSFFLGISTNKYVIMMFVYIIMFIAGMFVQTTPCIVILSPLLLGVVTQVGIDPVHFGLVMVLALSIAFVTPPVASNLFVTSSMTGIPINKIIGPMMPFLFGLIFALILVGTFPEITWFFINLLN